MISTTGLVWHPACGAGHRSSDVAADYRAEQHVLSGLAPGWQWPARLSFPSEAPDGSGIAYGRGFGAMAADSYWFCSWASRAVSFPRDRGRALRRLAQIRGTPFFRESLAPEDRPRFLAILTSAGRGNLVPLRQHVTANCRAR